jgi:hypothetical protein
MQFGIHLVRAGALTAEDFVDVLERQCRARPTLGELAIQTRKLSMREVFAILSAQAGSHKQFGEIAVQQGYLTRTELTDLLALQTERSRPLFEIVREMGLLDHETLQRHLQEFRSSALRQSFDREAAAETDKRTPAGMPE